MFPRKLILRSISKNRYFNFSTGFISRNQEKVENESERMKEFREKLKSEMTADDLLLIEVDPKSGEYIPESEKNPTKWGDWQIGGRVSDF
ncbi:uncharacterized protein [Fopius arisanus]|uniref:Succinate dehydrogenase assembly factor 4, mitochondrial n=1 Tax=Fopius arisanus TaxID=64838 RepID=A0A9R1U6Y4_9HYME|nr:PREDICTED: uncharacterized protein LOC105271399 [Fopius arisanus]